MFNATPQQLEDVREQYRQRRRDEAFGIWPDNWRAFELFLACGDQWTIHAGMGGVHYQTIDHRVLDSAEARMPPEPGTIVPPPRELFRQFRVLVREARDLLNQQG